MTAKFSVEKDKRIILQKYTYIWEVREVIFFIPACEWCMHGRVMVARRWIR